MLIPINCEAVLTEDFATGTEVSNTDFLETLGDEEVEQSAESGENAEEAPAEPKLELPDHGVEWIDFGMMGSLSKKERQCLIDIVTNVVMQDAYGLKRSALQVAQPVGEINHGNILELCEGMCSQYSGLDFGDFDLGDLLGTILGGLQDANFKIDPFLTNLARGIVAMEGTIKTLSPNVNILNSFTSKVDLGFDFNLDLENPENMNPEIAVKLLQLANGVIDSSVKTAETLDMLEKGQIRVRTDFSFEEKALATVKQLTGYMIRALLIVALLIGSSLLCTTAMISGAVSGIAVALPVVGFAGFIVSLFFMYRLYRSIKKDK